MNINIIENAINFLADKFWSLPAIIFVILTSVIFTFVFNFIQIKKFFPGWKMVFSKDEPEESSSEEKNKISTFQAFINALSSSLGNGGVGGMAAVLVEGGPGAAFWVFVLGFFSMILRFVEVYAGLVIKSKDKNLNGPLAYISYLPFGNFWVYFYAFAMLIYVFCAGIAMQCNTMGLALAKMTNFLPNTIAIIFSIFVLYILLGGSARIMKMAEIIIPIKVGAFFVGIILLLYYNFEKIPETINFILECAFKKESFIIGTTVFTTQKAISSSFSKALNATEAGVGTASIFFGSTETKKPIKSAITSMITAFISTDLVCAMLLFCLVLTGVLKTGLQSSQLVIAAFESVFGNLAASVITFLSFSFGLGVMVAYSFLGSKMWDFIFGKKSSFIYIGILVLMAYFGTVSKVSLIWKSMDVIAGTLIMINLFALLYNLPKLKEIFDKEISEKK